MSKPANQNQAKSNRPLIFLDLDGVLSDFMLHAENCGKCDHKGRVDQSKLDQHWWSTIPAFEGAKEFYDAVCKLGHTRFLTGASLHDGSFGGKANWVSKFVPERADILRDLMICSSDNKELVAKPGRILVDDRQKNVDAWKKAGGIGILHTGDFTETMRALENAVLQLVQEAGHAAQNRHKGMTP